MSNIPSLSTEQFSVIRDQFSFENKPLTVVTINGDPWFIAKEVAAHLGVGDAVRYAKEKHKRVLRKADFKNHDNTSQVLSLFKSTVSSIAIVNESGLYFLAVRGRTVEAERFTDWITEEVLPSIHKTGKYELRPTQSKDIAETSAVLNEIKGLKAGLAVRVKEHEEDVNYLVDELAILKKQMELMALAGNRAGPAPGSRPQPCFDHVVNQIEFGVFDGIIFRRNANKIIYECLVDELKNTYPIYDRFQNEDLVRSDYVSALIRRRRRALYEANRTLT